MQVFFRRRPKNSRAQKLKLKKFFAKTQAFFFKKKLKKPENAGNLFALYHKYILFSVYVSDFTQKRQNIMFLQSKLKEFSKTQWKLKDFSKTQGQNSPQNCKNSRFRKLHLPTVPKKRLKKSLL